MAQSSGLHRGIVKLVLSGDMIVVRGQPKGGPPPERTIALSYIVAPKLGRRANPGGERSTETKDEPYAWAAREFLRKLLVGKEVTFVVEHKTSGGREYGMVWVKKGGENVNVNDAIVAEGLVEVRSSNVKPSEDLTRLVQLEADAKSQGKGKWSKEPSANAVRNVTWVVENLRQFVDKNIGKELEAVVEHVRDGCTLRTITVPSFQLITVAMSGIKCPTMRREGEKEVSEPYYELARFFTESRILQKEIKLLIEGISNQNLVLATVIHPAGDIAELLLKEGFAWCVDWSMAVVTSGKERLRAAEREAKEKRLRKWKDYQPTNTALSLPVSSRSFSGKVVEVVNADALVVKTEKGQYQKVFFSSFRPPKKPEDASETTQSGQRSRLLYDVPYMFEAREFLRKKLIGKKVNVVVDYIKPAQDHFPERYCCTVTREGINFAEALISKGLGTCLKHGKNDDQRSSHYDELLTAETRAIKNAKGLHTKKDAPTLRVAEISGDPAKARQFLPFLQRAGRTTALVEFVASGSRMRLYLPKDTCLITFMIAGINCPRVARIMDKREVPADPFGPAALTFTKELVLQREVDVEVESCDKGGNFIGWMFVDDKNLAISLVEEGLATVMPQADRSSYAHQLHAAEESARSARKNVWEDYQEPQGNGDGEDDEDEEEENETAEKEEKKDGEVATTSPPERKTDYTKVIVTEMVSCTSFYAQRVDQGAKFEADMEQMRSDLAVSPPLPGAYSPRKNQMCVAKFVDGLWYRAQVEKVVSPKEVHVLYIDYGNRQKVPSTDLANLPPGYSFPPQAKLFHLACVMVPTDEDWQHEAATALKQQLMDKVVQLNVEYRSQGLEYVSLLQSSEDPQDIVESLISEGLLAVESRRESKLKHLVSKYKSAEEKARRAHINIWCYGDFTADDAKEFGYNKS